MFTQTGSPSVPKDMAHNGMVVCRILSSIHMEWGCCLLTVMVCERVGKWELQLAIRAGTSGLGCTEATEAQWLPQRSLDVVPQSMIRLQPPSWRKDWNRATLPCGLSRNRIIRQLNK